MSFGTLYSFTGNARTTALLAVAKANALDVDLVEVKPQDPEHVAKFPLGRVPGFIGKDGTYLHETMAIAIYFASQNEKTTLLGKTKADYASILMWMSVANTEVLPGIAQWGAPLIGRAPYNKKNVEDAEKKFNTTIAPYLEKTLSSRTYLVGHRVTLADLVLAAHLARGFEWVFGDAWQEQFPNVTRYFKTVANQHIYKNVAGDLKICKEPAKYTAPAKEKKEQAPKQAAQPKAAAAKKAAEKDDEEDEPVVEKKAKHPLEAAPTGSLVLDEWKRQYSNEDTPVALEWFWKNLDKEHYSLWRVDYKYNDELTLTFMSANLVGGFFSRLEASRKFIFGSMSVYGESNASVITGAFLVRGQDALPAFDVAPDFESYEFKKLNPEDKADKAFVEAQWSWDKPVEVGGKSYEHADGKVFK